MNGFEVEESYDLFKGAYKKLAEFIETDKATEKDMIAIIIYFRISFGFGCKFLQKFLISKGMLNQEGEEQAIKRANRYNVMKDEEIWLKMLKDTNLLKDIYKGDVVEKLYQSIKEEYIGAFDRFAETFDEKILKK